MEHRVLTRHRLCRSLDSGIVTATGELFDARQYSLMKFGSLADARAIGVELGRYIVAQLPDLIYDERRICSPYMYKHIPSAARMAAKYAFALVNDARASVGLDRIHTRQIYIGKQPNADYSKLDAAGRRQYMLDSGLQLVTSPLDGYNVLLLDDIRITGNYASLVRDMVSQYDIGVMQEVYWATVDPSVVATDPAVENAINSSAGGGLELIREIVTFGQLVPTLRTLKAILAHPDQEELRQFLISLPEDVLVELYESAAGTGSDLVEMYTANYPVLRDAAQATSIMKGGYTERVWA
jgi:hypothetical protein